MRARVRSEGRHAIGGSGPIPATTFREMPSFHIGQPATEGGPDGESHSGLWRHLIRGKGAEMRPPTVGEI